MRNIFYLLVARRCSQVKPRGLYLNNLADDFDAWIRLLVNFRPKPTFAGFQVEEPAGTPTVSKTYFLGSQAIAQRNIGGLGGDTFGLFYIQADHLGSATLLTHGQGNGGGTAGSVAASSEQRFLPFGGARTGFPATLDYTERGFTGHLHNDDVGLIYMNARFYLPGVGRFASADTLVPDPGNVQSYNRYSYTINNPLNRIDPTGHWDCVQDENYDACKASIEAWLQMLWEDGGDVARGVYLWFLFYDGFWTVENGKGVMFEFKEIQANAQVPFCGGATGACNLIRDPKINFNVNFLNETTGESALRHAVTLAHEITHLQQGDLLAASTLGEASAYYVAALISDEFQLLKTGRQRFMQNAMQGGFTYDELLDFNAMGVSVLLFPALSEPNGYLALNLALTTDYSQAVNENVAQYMDLSHWYNSAIQNSYQIPSDRPQPY